MTERTIFLDALGKEDPAERAAYLDAVCAGKPGLRERIEELLRSHREAGPFLDVPVLEQIAAADRSRTLPGPPRAPAALESGSGSPASDRPAAAPDRAEPPPGQGRGDGGEANGAE